MCYNTSCTKMFYCKVCVAWLNSCLSVIPTNIHINQLYNHETICVHKCKIVLFIMHVSTLVHQMHLHLFGNEVINITFYTGKLYTTSGRRRYNLCYKCETICHEIDTFKMLLLICYLEQPDVLLISMGCYVPFRDRPKSCMWDAKGT